MEYFFGKIQKSYFSPNFGTFTQKKRFFARTLALSLSTIDLFDLLHAKFQKSYGFLQKIKFAFILIRKCFGHKNNTL